MPIPPHMSSEEFRAVAHRLVDWIAAYHERVESLPVLSRAKPGELLGALPEHPPSEGVGAPALAGAASPLKPPVAQERVASAWDEVFRDLDALIVPGLTHWQSPNFFGFFPCNASGPAILGELASAGLDVIGMMWATSPAATELEIRVLDWLAEMLDLPAKFRSTSAGGGVIQGTASESTLTAMVAARRRVMRGLERAQSRHLVAYASTQAHSSVIKAAMVAGLADGPQDRTHLRLIDCDEHFAMRADLLERAMREDVAAGRVPFFVCATVGTTSSAAVDPVDKIAALLEWPPTPEEVDPPQWPTREPSDSVGTLCNPPPLPVRPWLHVDAAYAGAACICPEFRPMLAGVEHADSICFNPHKWLLTNFDCDAFWVADRAALIDALSITPEYLRNTASESGEVTDFRDWQIPLGRRFRALKLWFVIRHYGVEGLRTHIREHVRLAALIENWVREDRRFELGAPRSLSLVCFRLRGEGDAADVRNRLLLERINASGKLFLTHTSLRGPDGRDRFVIRMAIGATHTQERHVRAAWDLIRATAGQLEQDEKGRA